MGCGRLIQQKRGYPVPSVTLPSSESKIEQPGLYENEPPMRVKRRVHHLGSWSLNGALAKFDAESDDGDDVDNDGVDDEGLPFVL